MRHDGFRRLSLHEKGIDSSLNVMTVYEVTLVDEHFTKDSGQPAIFIKIHEVAMDYYLAC